MNKRSDRAMAILRSLAESQAYCLQARDLTLFYEQVVQVCNSELRADYTILTLWHEQDNTLIPTAIAGSLYQSQRVLSLDNSLEGWVTQYAEPLYITVNSAHSAQITELLNHIEARAIIVVPIFTLGRVVGTLTVGYREPLAQFEQSSIDIVNLLVNQVAITIERVRQPQPHASQPYLPQISDDLAQSEKLAGMVRLVASVAHEINNPLYAIHNSLHLLQTHAISDVKRERYLDMAQEQVERLIALVQRILNFYRPSREGMRPSSIHPLLAQVIRSISEQAENSHITIVSDWTEHLPRVMGTASHLRHVFQHLVLNAIEAMPEGGKLAIRTYTSTNDITNATYVTIDFVDEGPGIPEQELAVIFEPFYTTKRRGIGLGLSISYGIIEQHNGILSVQSNDQQTTFRIMLPALLDISGTM
jgi:signal transduction histidine kinase